MAARFIFSILFLIALSACSEDGNDFQEARVPNATLSSIQVNVFDRSCALSGCHNGDERPNLTSGSSFASLVNVGSSEGFEQVEPNNPSESYLFLKLVGGDIEGSIMPRGEAQLSTEITDSIKVWIENGALNN
ncbi:MAG: hypothetical protein ACRBF0_05295 [Calditrichia bacterium]